jgi:hypothetical protein
MSYGTPPIRGASLQTAKVDPRLFDVAGLGGAMMPAAKSLGKAALREGARQIETGTGIGRAALDPRTRMFAGEGAKTADKQALKVAKDMKAAGVPDETIHAKTKWFFGSADGKPRFEIDDSAAKIDFPAAGGKSSSSDAYDIISHRDLQSAYPNAPSLKIVNKDDPSFGGAYYSQLDGITVMRPDAAQAKSTTLHELQHAIQQRENFARGGSPDMFMRGYQNKLKDLNAQVTDINQQMRAVSGTPQYDELMNTRSGIVKQIQAIEGREGLGALEAANKDYRRLAGEAEARLTQSRMNMTAAQRAASYPPSMFDVPVKDQIVRYGDGKAMSVPKLQVKPPKEDIYSVADANFSMGIPSGNKTVKIDTLKGVMSSAADDAERVKKLAGQMSADGGYIERLIVDQNGNVIEGQHRLNALRSLGVTDIPVSVIQDASPTYDLLMKSGKLRSEHARQIVRDSAEMLKSEGGDVRAVLSGYDLPKGYEQYFTDAVNDLSKLKSMSVPERNGVGGAMIPRPKTEFEILHDTAQRNAALPVEQGGLGLPANNTYIDRANAPGMFPEDAVHFSRAGGDYTTLDSGKYAIAPFDAVGTHVGTPQAAMERFENTVGYKVNDPNYINDELKGASYPVRISNSKPLMNQNGMPFGEEDLNTLLRQDGGHNSPDISGGDRELNAKLRKKLFEDQGYTNIPYFNEVEGKGSVSQIVPPENIRSRFAAFDPMRRHEADILAGVGVGGMLDPQAIAEALRQQDRK